MGSKRVSKNKIPDKQMKVMDEIFGKYAFSYDNSKTIQEKQDSVDRQRYVYDKLCEKELKNTDVERLIGMIMDDIQHQYSVKKDIEGKTGFMVTLWGVLLGVVLQLNLPYSVFSKILNGKLEWYIKAIGKVSIIGLIVTCVMSMYFIIRTLVGIEYRKVLYDDKEANYKCAVDDRYMSIVRILDANTNVWIYNEAANEKKYTNLKRQLICISGFIVFIVICYCLKMWGGK